MIDYGSDDDVAQLIAHKIGAYPDITPHNVKGMIMRVLSMMGHRPQDLGYVTKRVSEILASEGKMNESMLDELSLAAMDDETIHAEANEEAALYLRDQMRRYQPINLSRATKLVHRKYDGEKSRPDIHDTLLRFVKYLKLDGKFVSTPVNETPDVHALAAADERASSMSAGEHQRKHAEELALAKQIHQFARRNIRGDNMGVDEATEYQKLEAKRKRHPVVMGPLVDVEADRDASYLIARMKNYGAINLDRATTLVKTNFSDKTEEEQKSIVHVFVEKLKSIGKFVDYKNMNESSKHREIMNAHFKRAREHLYGFPTATQDDCEHEPESNTTTVMSAGDADVSEAEEIESTDGADGEIGEDGDVMTEGSEATIDMARDKAQAVLDIEGHPVNVEVTYAYQENGDDSPIELIEVTRLDTGETIKPEQLSVIDSYNLTSQCFHAHFDESEMAECDTPMVESDQNGQFELKTLVSTSEEDDIDVVVHYDVDGDDDGSYAVIRSVNRQDTNEDIKGQINPADLVTVEDECYQDYLAYAKEENDQAAIDRHIWNKANESLDEDMRPAEAPISDQRAARKVVHEIMGLPNLTYAVVEKWVSKMIAKLGKTADDIEAIARLAFNELAKVGMAIKESEDDAEPLEEAEHAKVRNSTLELPVDDPDYETDDVDVTVEYTYEYHDGGRDEPSGAMVNITKITRDDTGEDITKSITSEQRAMLEQGCADAGEGADDLHGSSHDPYQQWKDRQMEESDDGLSASDYLDKRVTDYFDAAGSGLTKGTYKTWGKVFNTYVFDTDAAANAFMEENSGWGVIGVDDDGKVHVAKMGDVGVEESEQVVKVPRDQQKSLEDEIEVGGRNGEEQQLAYIKRMKALAGLK
jgi:hypothetical protein